MYIYKISNDLQQLNNHNPCPGLFPKREHQERGGAGPTVGLLRVRIKKGHVLWSFILHKPWFFISLRVECRNPTGFTFTNLGLLFCGQGRLWLSFLTAIYLIHGTTFIMYAFLWEKKHVTNCLYILAPCKVFFLFYTKVQ